MESLGGSGSEAAPSFVSICLQIHARGPTQERSLYRDRNPYAHTACRTDNTFQLCQAIQDYLNHGRKGTLYPVTEDAPSGSAGHTANARRQFSHATAFDVAVYKRLAEEKTDRLTM